MSTERAVSFECQGEPLLGILHETDRQGASLGVLIVVGGPQYRVGSHRQFVLMARAFASAGFPTFRFDYRGMGDSAADPQTFDAVDDDLRAAIDAFIANRPGLRRIVIFGLCDAASAAMIYAPSDARVRGLILANPWVRSVAGEARAYVRHYYGQRLLQESFWRKVLGGGLDIRGSVADFVTKLRQSGNATASDGTFVDRMLRGLRQFDGPALLLISERDLTASEFEDLCRADSAWQHTVSAEFRTKLTLAAADHTFSSADAMHRATGACVSWLGGLAAGPESAVR